MDRNISRRKALRQGAMVGGALWVVPTVQVIGLSPASAQQVSGPPSTANPPSSVGVEPSGSPVESPGTGQPENARPATPVAGEPDYAG